MILRDFKVREHHLIHEAADLRDGSPVKGSRREVLQRLSKVKATDSSAVKLHRIQKI